MHYKVRQAKRDIRGCQSAGRESTTSLCCILSSRKLERSLSNSSDAIVQTGGSEDNAAAASTRSLRPFAKPNPRPCKSVFVPDRLQRIAFDSTELLAAYKHRPIPRAPLPPAPVKHVPGLLLPCSDYDIPVSEPPLHYDYDGLRLPRRGPRRRLLMLLLLTAIPRIDLLVFAAYAICTCYCILNATCCSLPCISH